MAVEIERKYLVQGASYRELATDRFEIKQGYLSRDKERTVRVRTKADHAFLTIKGKTTGAVRAEFEYEIPYQDALQLLTMCEPPVIEKTRYVVPFCGQVWEVDEFHNVAAPEGGEILTVAEIELPSADATYALPPFAGLEVTADPRYYNSALKAI